MTSLQISLITPNSTERCAWRLLLRALGSSVRCVPPRALRPTGPVDLWVWVVEPWATVDISAACARQLTTRTLLACDSAWLAERLCKLIPHPTLITDHALARACLPDQIQLLCDMQAGKLTYVGLQQAGAPQRTYTPQARAVGGV